MTDRHDAQSPPGVKQPTRRNFLRTAGSLLGAGAGVLMFASEASAAPASYNCCRVFDATCPGCPSPDRQRYLCTPNAGTPCEGSAFCGCFANSRPQCFTLAC